MLKYSEYITDSNIHVVYTEASFVLSKKKFFFQIECIHHQYKLPNGRSVSTP